MKIYRGTKGPDRQPCKWIEARITFQWELWDLISGLCSKYSRDRFEGDDPLPESLSRDEVIGTVKDEYAYRGINTVRTWADNLNEAESLEAEDWARGIILRVMPDLETPQVAP